jgi:hypothetical protein
LVQNRKVDVVRDPRGHIGQSHFETGSGTRLSLEIVVGHIFRRLFTARELVMPALMIQEIEKSSVKAFRDHVLVCFFNMKDNLIRVLFLVRITSRADVRSILGDRSGEQVP